MGALPVLPHMGLALRQVQVRYVRRSVVTECLFACLLMRYACRRMHTHHG